MTIKPELQSYFDALKVHHPNKSTEHTYRAPLEALLIAVAEERARGASVQHEPRQQGKFGRPDFLLKQNGTVLGYVEVKKIGEDLDEVLKSDQIKKYKELSDNILLTDYLRFIWIRSGNVQMDETLAYEADLGKPRSLLTSERSNAVWDLLERLFSLRPEPLRDPKQFAEILALRTRRLREFLDEELTRQKAENRGGRLFGLYLTFQKDVFPQLQLRDFADAFAQNLTYSLFLAKLNAPEGEEITLTTAQDFIPENFAVVRDLATFLNDLRKNEYLPIKWLIEELLAVMNNLDLESIRAKMVFNKGQQKIFKGEAEDRSADPYVYFYEDFLAKYDSKMREARGVYYTPPQVVSFIVRSLQCILEDTFGLSDGFADRNVTVLDFATGTGTFLLEIMRQVFVKLGEGSGKKDSYIREHILQHFYGFEYLLAPYTVAHLKLSQYLREQGHPLATDERLQVYLTNTLDFNEDPPLAAMLPAVAREVRDAQRVKEQPILVICGNPPYSGESNNKSTWITSLIDDYKKIEGVKLKERNWKWLQDDYVKFIRFAEKKMEVIEQGVVGIITNHSYLDNPTFRGMRWHLMQTFDQIYILDYHGNSKKKEVAPDGSHDQNVFDIQQGVALAFFVKKPGLSKKDKGIFHLDLWGKRSQKYYFSLANDLRTLAADWKRIAPQAPFYLFRESDAESENKYYRYAIGINELFSVNGTGIVTKRDKLTIHLGPDEVMEAVQDFLEKSEDFVRNKYQLPEDVRDWKYEWAKADLKEAGFSKDLVQPINYRPFDVRHIYYTGKSRGFVGWPVEKLMRHMLQPNIGIVTSRQAGVIGEPTFEAVCVIDSLGEFNYFRRGGINLFPLYLYETGEGFFESEGTTRRENLDPKLRSELEARYNHRHTPEELLGMIYAVLHSPTYRVKYAKFLRNDFPRIPFPDDKATFDRASSLGWELLETHLLRKIPNIKKYPFGTFNGKGSNHIDKGYPKYDASEQLIRINPHQFFAPVSEEVFGFTIGGYQPLEKWLGDRCGRTLTLDEVEHYERVVRVLAFTRDQMAHIDAATKGWV